MRGLTILVATADPARYHAALSLAAAQAAPGGRARVYLHAEAAALLANATSDPRQGDAGLPSLVELRREAAALGVETIVCQTGLTLAGLDHAALGEEVAAGGLVSLLASLGEDRLIAF